MATVKKNPKRNLKQNTVPSDETPVPSDELKDIKPSDPPDPKPSESPKIKIDTKIAVFGLLALGCLYVYWPKKQTIQEPVVKMLDPVITIPPPKKTRKF
jgi:hypothetical protein